MELTTEQLSNKLSFKDKLIKGFRSYDSKVNWFVFILIIVFSWSGWLDIFGIWSELPIIVQTLPEGWRLPGIITGFIQLGQIATLFTLILSLIWNKTWFLLGENRSIGLLICVCVFSLCNGLATLASVPFITKLFKKEYIIPHYIGEGLYSLIPGTFAMLQGVGQDLGCKNVTVLSKTNYSTMFNLTIQEPVPIEPFFSVSNYFIIMFMFLFMSTIAFICMNCLSSVKKEYKRDSCINNHECDKQKNSLLDTTPTQNKDSERQIKAENRNEKLILYVLSFLTTFFSLGIQSGFQSYSTLPYGYLLNPIAVFLSVWSYNVSVKRISIEFIIAFLFTIYIIICGSMSPCPPLLNSVIGSILIVSSWIVSLSLYIRIRCLISTRLEPFGEIPLLLSSVFTLLGEVIGGLIIFILVEKLRLFTEKPECVFDFSFCSI